MGGPSERSALLGAPRTDAIPIMVVCTPGDDCAVVDGGGSGAAKAAAAGAPPPATPLTPLVPDIHESSSWGLWLAVLATTAGPLAVGWSLGFTSPTTSPDALYPVPGRLDSDMRMTAEEVTSFGSLINLGCGVGALIGGYPTDRFGRRPTIVAANALFLVGWLLLVFTPEVPATASGNAAAIAQLISARIVTGLAIGATCCSVIPYQVEIATLKLRGLIGSGFQVGVVCGFVMVYGLGIPFRWRTLCWIGAGVNAAGLLGALWAPESPQWLVSQGENDAALAALRRLRAVDATDVEDLIEYIDSTVNHGRTHSGGRRRVAAMVHALTKAPRGKALAIGVALAIFQQGCGINTLMFYASHVLGIVFPDSDTAKLVALGGQAVQMGCTICAAALFDKFGRKAMFLASASGVFVSAMVLWAYFALQVLPAAMSVGGFYGFIAAFSFGMGALPWIMLSEMFHPQVRGQQAAICTAVNWFTSFAVTKSVSALQDAFGGGEGGMGWVFFMYACVTVGCIVFAASVLPETKGKRYKQIEAELRGKAAEGGQTVKPTFANPASSPQHQRLSAP
eukprot:TRINITY_DN5318_c0_g6_i1.p1 TRINITY_DN5318_c0_g6~~TRINITY_DN5318_c0_g6_i1.p1  ORF type:complete len:565 (+),score=158.61 TRINITY_DN5318_c0_g6_i1:51-1745(+)